VWAPAATPWILFDEEAVKLKMETGELVLGTTLIVPLEIDMVPVTRYVPVVKTCTTPDEAEITVGFEESVTTPLDTETVPVTTYVPEVRT
jgi:hypothetical protein